MAFVYAWIVPLWADQLLPQLLMEQLDTLLIQCRHIEHFVCLFDLILYVHSNTLSICMKEFIFFCTDSTEIFSKLRSAGLNYNLPSFFTDSYRAGVI